MDIYRLTFREIYERYKDGAAAPITLKEGVDSDVMYIPAQVPNGFDISLECFDYGVYPSSSVGWHGGSWDKTVIEPEELKKLIPEFIDSILNNAVLEVVSSNGRAFKWRLNVDCDGQRDWVEMGLLFFNWFGRRSKQSLCNGSSQSNKAN